MDSVIEARRAKFEAWAAEKWLDNPDVLKRCGYGYMYDPADTAWYGYEAALDSLVIKLPFEACNGMMNGERVRQAIEKAGVKVK
jgi:hypothetical protein